MAVRIGELLLKEKRITPAQLQEALNHQKANGGKVGVSLVRLGFVTDEEITAGLAALDRRDPTEPLLPADLTLLAYSASEDVRSGTAPA